jgi:hypothetical protein
LRQVAQNEVAFLDLVRAELCDCRLAEIDAAGIGMSIAVTLMPASPIFCMMVAPKLASVWNSMT